MLDVTANLMKVPQGEFELERCPENEHLRAWDAADEFLLDHLNELQILTRDSQILILNDSFGALGVALAEHPVFSWNDSCLAQEALRANLQRNGYSADQVRVNSEVGIPQVPVDCILIKIPKTSALLEHQLYAVRNVLHPESRIIAAGMARHIHTSTLELFETILGPTTTTRARKKARLVLLERDFSLNQGENPFPDSYELELDRVYQIINHANLFSRDHLDNGTRCLIENIPIDENRKRIVDLGCGNGVVGIVAAAMNPAAELLFCDESYMAVASAKTNFEAAFGTERVADFSVINSLEGVGRESRDLILINPPFHQQHSTGDEIAWKMFTDARRVLVEGGEIRIVANRHLGYHAKLKKLFGNCETLSSNNKFVVLSAIR